MFGFGKKNRPIKSVEDYLNSQEGQEGHGGVGIKSPRLETIDTLKARTIPFAIGVVALIIIVVLFTKISQLRSDVAALKMQRMESKNVELRLSELESKFNMVSGNLQVVNRKVTALEEELQARKAAVAKVVQRKPKAAKAAVKKPASQKNKITKKKR